MDNFITAIRKTNTDGLIFFFSRLSIEMFKNNEYIMNLQYPLFKNGLLQNHTVTLMGWDILSTECQCNPMSALIRKSVGMIPAHAVAG